MNAGIKIMKTTGLILLVILIMTSCRVTEKYKRPDGIAGNNLYRDITSADTTTIAVLPWKQLFTDTLLQMLIQEGIENNLDLKIAMARIKQAQANLQLSNAVVFPNLEGHLTATTQKSANNFTNASKFVQLYATSNWEADIWGKLRSAKRASLAALLQSEAYQKAVQTQLISEIASGYYALLAYDAQLEVTLKTVDVRNMDVSAIKLLKESGVVNGAAVVQSEANLYSAEIMVPDFKQNIRVTENALSILLGRNPGGINRDSLGKQQILPDLQTGVPAQLLSNRPDVQEAEYQLRYYFELTNIAKSNFYPSLNITAQGGFSNATLSQLFNTSSLFGNIAGGLLQPIFNQGLNKQKLRIAQAQQEEYVASFKKVLLNAGEEVSNALYNYQTETDKIKIRSQQIGYLQKSVEFTKELLRYSANTNYTDVLTSEQNLLAAQLNSVNDKVQQLQAIVALYRSLGGGSK